MDVTLFSCQTLIPGAINQAGARVSLSQEDGVSVNGARGNDNNVLLDGGHNNDLYDGTPTAMPNPDALQEFSVLSSSFSAEYGRGAGSLVTAVTKSGTNVIMARSTSICGTTCSMHGRSSVTPGWWPNRL